MKLLEVLLGFPAPEQALRPVPCACASLRGGEALVQADTSANNGKVGVWSCCQRALAWRETFTNHLAL